MTARLRTVADYPVKIFLPNFGLTTVIYHKIHKWENQLIFTALYASDNYKKFMIFLNLKIVI